MRPINHFRRDGYKRILSSSQAFSRGDFSSRDDAINWQCHGFRGFRCSACWSHNVRWSYAWLPHQVPGLNSFV